MNIIGNVFINSGGSDNLWCVGAKATQKGFVALKFISKLTSTL